LAWTQDSGDATSNEYGGGKGEIENQRDISYKCGEKGGEVETRRRRRMRYDAGEIGPEDAGKGRA